MSDITALLDALKGLWWPVAAVIIAVVYKIEIRTLIPRLRRAGPTGVEFDPAAQQQAVTAANNPAPGQLRQFPGMARTVAMERLERQLHTQLAALTNMSDEEKRDLLITRLAQTQLQEFFERIYNAIYGSQIVALRRLNEIGRVSIEDARSLFEQYATQYPQIYTNYTFGQWVNFLIDNGLVSRSDNFFEIVDLGREFLIFITARRLTENKVG